MGIEKQSSRSGNYVGGFLQLFDWNAKSRKKLFSSKSDFPEKFKQQKRFDGNLPTTRLQMLDEDEAVAQSSMKGSSDHSCASSVMDEDSYGSRGPGVVARLMGLDSLPKSNAQDPLSTPLSDSHSLPGSFYHSKDLDYRQDPQIMLSSRQQQLGVGIRPEMEPKYQKVMQKFQTEVLPPRSAKAIPITHHKLLSPIKSTTFIPPKDAVHIMEAAARILEMGPEPQVSRKPVIPLSGSSLVPLKVRDFKEKVRTTQKSSKPCEGSRRPGETRGVKHPRGNSTNKSSNSGSADAMSVRSSQDSVEVSSGVKSKGKSVSLALQAKANVQRRTTSSNSCGNRSETNEFSPNMLFTSQSGSQKSALKKASAQKSSSVLRQNNQKQNCVVDGGKLPLKSNSQGVKAVGRQSSGKLVGSSKASSRKLDSEAKDDKSGVSSCSSERVTRKKRSIEGNQQSDKNGKIIQSTAIVDTKSSWDPDSGKEGTDVISFTFTAPLRSTEFQENCKIFPVDSPSKRIMLNSDGMAASKFSLLGHSFKESDSLSTFLELQLKELAHKVELSQQKSGQVSLKSSSMGEHRTKDGTVVGQPRSSLYSLRDPKHFIAGQNIEAMMLEKGMIGQNITDDRTFLSCRLPSPVSVLEHSSFTESCNSTHDADNHGSNKYSSVQSEDRYSIDTFLPFEGDAELSDTFSSTSTGTMPKTPNTILTSSKYGKPRSLELKYIKDMLCNIDLTFKDYTTGMATHIITPHLFYQLESCKKYRNSSGLVSNTNRRLMFDSVTECLEMRFRKYGAGGYELWEKGMRVTKRKEILAEDVYKEISSWNAMGDFMVDELVDSDMSSGMQGRWLDYCVEEFELGIQIESRILNSLIDEVVADMLVL